MPTLKSVLLKSLGVGLGIGIGLGIAVGLYAWYSSRPIAPKPWNSTAIAASFLTAETGGDNNHFVFRYILENHTDRDYRVKTSELHLSAILQQQAALTGSGTGEIKFVEDSIFIPAKDHAEIHIELQNYRFPGDGSPNDDAPREEHTKYHDAVKKYVDEHLTLLNGFSAFDDINRYRINFPNGWHNPKN